MTRNKYSFVLIGILVLGVFFRFWRLAELPPGLHPDEAANGLDIFRMFDHHDFRPLYNTNGPREALFFYIQAVFVAVFGNTVVALRYAPALIGSLSVLVTYAWVNSWFGKQQALIAAFLLAITPWAVTISRDGFRASMVPLMLPLTLWLYTKGFQTKSRWWFVSAGFSLGAGFYTYLAWRLLPVALLLILVYLAIWRRSYLVKWAKPLLLSVAVCAVTLLPLVAYGLAHPADMFVRAGSVSFLNPAFNHGHPVAALFDSSIKTALMFNVRGDENFRQNFAGYPEFNVFVGALFIIGFLIALAKHGSVRYFGLLVVFLVMLLPATLTAEGIPHALRAIGALVPAITLAAVGAGYVLDLWPAEFKKSTVLRMARRGATVIVLGFCLYQGYQQYFVAWAGSLMTRKAYNEDAVAMAAYLNSNARYAGRNFVVIGEYSNKTVEFLTHNHSIYTRIDTGAIDALSSDGRNMKFLIGRSKRNRSQLKLAQRFPGGTWTPHASSFSGAVLYYTYEVK